MQLDEYLSKYGITQVRFSEMCGVSKGTIYNIVSGRKKPNPPLAMRIEQMTNGRVSAYGIVSSSNISKVGKAKVYDYEEKKQPKEFYEKARSSN